MRVLLRPFLLVSGLYHLALGAAAFGAPRAFYDAIAGFPPYNDHFLRDVGSFYLVIGAASLVAAARRDWQVPVLAIVAGQYAVHTLAHVIDVEDSEPAWVGPATAAGLLAGTLLFGWLWRRAATDRASGGSDAGPRRRRRGPSSPASPGP